MIFPRPRCAFSACAPVTNASLYMDAMASRTRCASSRGGTGWSFREYRPLSPAVNKPPPDTGCGDTDNPFSKHDRHAPMTCAPLGPYARSSDLQRNCAQAGTKKTLLMPDFSCSSGRSKSDHGTRRHFRPSLMLQPLSFSLRKNGERDERPAAFPEKSLRKALSRIGTSAGRPELSFPERPAGAMLHVSSAFRPGFSAQRQHMLSALRSSNRRGESTGSPGISASDSVVYRTGALKAAENGKHPYAFKTPVLPNPPVCAEAGLKEKGSHKVTPSIRSI